MIWIVLSVFAVIVAIAGFLIGLFGRAAMRRENAEGLSTALILSPFGIVLAWGLFSLIPMLHQVPAGYVGLVYEFEDIVGQREAGLQVIAPWQTFKTADIRIQKIRPETTCQDGQEEECLEAFSSETQDIFIRPTLNISVNPDDVQDLFRTVGEDYLAKLVRPRMHQIFKDETVKYGSVDVAPAREEIRIAVRARLREELAGFSINVDDLLLDNVDFRPQFKQSIEDKQIATQEALREKELIKASEAKADQAIAEATGIAESNRLINESLTPLLVQFQAMQKLAPNLQIALIPSGEGIIIDPSTLLGPLSEPAVPSGR